MESVCHEHSSQSCRLALILFTHVFSHLRALREAKYVGSLENGEDGSKSRINTAAWSLFAGGTLFCLPVLTFRSPGPGANL